MTNAQKWVAAFLFLFIFLFFLAKLTKENDNTTNDIEIFNNESNAEKTIPEIIANVGCNKCHGDNLQGTDLAPSLINIGEHWSRTELINYLRNPNSYGNDERFIAYKKKYKTPMTSFSDVNIKTLGKIADYVLQLK